MAGNRELWCTHLAAARWQNSGARIVGLLFISSGTAALDIFLEAIV
jgi:hypothetical protein